jgi:hypothetical protein
LILLQALGKQINNIEPTKNALDDQRYISSAKTLRTFSSSESNGTQKVNKVNENVSTTEKTISEI